MGNGKTREKQHEEMKVGGAPHDGSGDKRKSHLSFGSLAAITTNHFITPSAFWRSRHLYSPPASAGLRKCLDVKFKQHKCLPAKQSSSESCGTQSSLFFFFGVGRERQCGGAVAENFLSDSQAESPGSCIVFLKVFGAREPPRLHFESTSLPFR